MTYKVAVVGASGYVGGELLRLIAHHKDLELRTVTANSNVGEIVSVFHDVPKFSDIKFVETNKENLVGHDVIFLALPHTKSAEVAAWLPEDVLVLDCGADFRLESSEEFEKFYGTVHAGTWTYGMPELLTSPTTKLREKLIGVKRVAVPGCNATAMSLAYAPLLSAGVIESDDLVSTLSVGTSGAGRNSEANKDNAPAIDSAYAYQVGGVHRHIPEVIQNLQRVVESKVTLSFTPVLVPMFRGILAVNTAKLISGVSAVDIRSAIEKAYANEVHIDLLPEGEFPNTSNVELKNKVQIGFKIDEANNRVIVISAIDNLVKGTAGAAIQSMNLALGLPENTGIES
jgi:N-acetyl-gamma-glutamyl-phosphate reductase